jgi:DNA repair exonuclease SbcCD ATPase subunit
VQGGGIKMFSSPAIDKALDLLSKFIEKFHAWFVNLDEFYNTLHEARKEKELLITKLEEYKTLLKDLEHCQTENEYDYNWEDELETIWTRYVCPVCGYEEGHTKDCKLHELIK